MFAIKVLFPSSIKYTTEIFMSVQHVFREESAPTATHLRAEERAVTGTY